MNVAIMKESTCINACLFDQLDTARTFLRLNTWPGADDVLALPEGFGIGDRCADGVWTHEAEEVPTAQDVRPSYEELVRRIEELESHATGVM